MEAEEKGKQQAHPQPVHSPLVRHCYSDQSLEAGKQEEQTHPFLPQSELPQKERLLPLLKSRSANG